MMQIEGIAMKRNLLLAGIIALVLGTAPAIAKDDFSDSDAAPTSLTAAPNDQPSSDIPPLATDSSDPLAGFGPSSGTVVGNRALELRDDVLRLRASVNLNTNEFQGLRSTGAAGAVQYHSTIAAITARLQNGTTRGNPILLRQWDEASSNLDEVTTSLNRLNALATAIDADASMASYLTQSIQAAFQLSGAVDEDHDQLKLLRDETSRLVVQLDYLRNQTTNDIERQNNYLMSERANLQVLSFAISRGEMVGNNFPTSPVIINSSVYAAQPQVSYAPPPPPAAPAPVAYSSAPIAAAPISAPAPIPAAVPTPVSSVPVSTTPVPTPALPPAPTPTSSLSPLPAPALSPPPPAPPTPVASPAAPVTTGALNNAANEIHDAEVADAKGDTTSSLGQLLVLIRYDQPNIDYEPQLSQAIGNAIERRPNAEFSVVPVAPSSGTPSDIAKMQQTAQSDAEAVTRSLVRLGLAPSRITLASTQVTGAQTPEVHVYIR